MDSLKTWLIDVGWKKLAPSLIKGAIGAGLGLMAAHQGLLNSLGITWDTQGHCVTLDLDTLSSWMVMAGSGVVMSALTAIQHHGTQVIAPKAE